MQHWKCSISLEVHHWKCIYFRFDDLWYKISILGSAALAFMCQVLKSDVDKEVDRKMKEKELKEKDKLLMDMQTQVEKEEAEIGNCRANSRRRGRDGFSRLVSIFYLQMNI